MQGGAEGKVAGARVAPARAPKEPGFRLGRVRGIEIRIDWSLAVIFWLIAFNLGAGLFPALHPDWGPALVWVLAILAATLFFGSVLAHELAHALMGQRHGVPIEGITLFIFGGVSRLGGEPRSARAEFYMAIVGPITSLLIGIAAVALGGWMGGLWADPEADMQTLLRRLGPTATILLWLGPINILLAVFNMLPGFPLDGGRVLRAIIWRITGDVQRATKWASGVGRGIALSLVFLGMLMIFGRRVPVLGGGLVQGLWLIFIGWFLNNAAVQSYQQTVMREMLRDVRVARLMRQDAAFVPPEMRASVLAEELLTSGDQRCFPVVASERLVGLVCLADLRKVPREAWPWTPVRDIMTPLEALSVVSPNEEVVEALRKLAARDVDQVPVVEQGRVLGILRRADVLRWIELRARA
jgi:Zn-dependent protease/CBS domain-containing protein